MTNLIIKIQTSVKFMSADEELSEPTSPVSKPIKFYPLQLQDILKGSNQLKTSTPRSQREIKILDNKPHKKHSVIAFLCNQQKKASKNGERVQYIYGQS